MGTIHYYENLNDAALVIERLAKLKARAEKHNWNVDLDWKLHPTEGAACKLELTYGGSFKVDDEWRLVAVADNTMTNDKPLVFVFDPEVTIGAVDLTRCDHCERKIARRKVLVIANSKNEVRHVGGHCAEDFFGHDPLWATWVAEAITDELPERSMRVPNELPLEILVRFALEAYRIGYHKVSESMSNKHIVLAMASGLFWLDNLSYSDVRKDIECAPPATITVEELIEWMASDDPDAREMNYNTLASCKVVNVTAAGLIAYAPAAFDKWRERMARLALEREAKAKALPVPLGRVTIEGRVASYKLVESVYGSTWKMRVVSDDGWAVWGSIPEAIDPEVNDRVRFVATIEPSDEPAFGFFKRPANAEIVA